MCAKIWTSEGGELCCLGRDLSHVNLVTLPKFLQYDYPCSGPYAGPIRFAWRIPIAASNRPVQLMGARELASNVTGTGPDSARASPQDVASGRLRASRIQGKRRTGSSPIA